MILYNLGIHLFNCALHLAAPFKTKARLWVEGRRGWRSKLEAAVSQKQLKGAVWFHCASLGEFEQGRPVIEKIKQLHPQQKIILTFFSPSGYEIQKDYPKADLIMYLPVDTPSNARYFLNVIQPKLSIFVKYEFWLNYLFELKKQHIPTFLISTVIKPHQSFFKWYGGDFRKALHAYTMIFTQDVYSLRLLKLLKVDTGSLAGDARFDRVLQICSSPKHIHEIEHFAKDAFVIIAGSSWAKDEELLVASYARLRQTNSKLKLIIAPHEIHKSNIDRLKNLLAKYQLNYHLFSDSEEVYTQPILVLNAIGFLSSVYQYGNVAVIGGGFSDGIHNILEPTVYGLPVLFGPNYQKFNEAHEILDLKAGFTFATEEELYNKLQLLINNQEELRIASLLAKNYVQKNSGATEKILKVLDTYLS